MILKNKIKIKINNSTLKLYKEKHNCKNGEIIEIDSCELSNSSTPKNMELSMLFKIKK